MSRARNLLEIASLFLALFLIMPYIPSHEGYEHRFGFLQVVAIVMFGFSRALRWGEKWYCTALEVAAFALFAWGLTASYALL